MDDKNCFLCLILNRDISEGTCFDIHMVVAGEAPTWSAPEEIYQVEGYVQLCKKCPYHHND